MAVHIEDVKLWMVDQIGARYVFGAETADPPPPHVEATDCSEYIQGGCNAAGVVPKMPDGAYYQWQHCRKRGLEIPVKQALATNGALLYIGDLTGVGREAVTHTAMSLGDGRTLEARGKAWPVGIFPGAASRKWATAGLIPGVDYTPRAPLPPITVPEDNDMAIVGRDIQDAMRGTVITAYWAVLGRGPSKAELAPGADVDVWKLVLAQRGFEGLMLAMGDVDEAKRRAARA